MWFNSNTAQNLTKFCIGDVVVINNCSLHSLHGLCRLYRTTFESEGVSVQNAGSIYFQITVATDKSAWLSSVVP